MFEDLDPPELTPAQEGKLWKESSILTHHRKWAVMRKFIADFFYYLRRGYGIRKSWRLATITL